MVARRPGGETRVYPPSLNYHARQTSRVVGIMPATLPVERHELAGGNRSWVSPTNPRWRGFSRWELFLLGDGSLLVNELAPRPSHNSFHQTEVASLHEPVRATRSRGPAIFHWAIRSATAWRDIQFVWRALGTSPRVAFRVPRSLGTGSHRGSLSAGKRLEARAPAERWDISRQRAIRLRRTRPCPCGRDRVGRAA